jgi:hypothetical protein
MSHGKQAPTTSRPKLDNSPKDWDEAFYDADDHVLYQDEMEVGEQPLRVERDDSEPR